MTQPHLICMVGEFGSGKSFALLEKGAWLSDRYRKSIVTNFHVNLDKFMEYCILKGYSWVQSMIWMGRVRYMPTFTLPELLRLGHVRDSVILLDEAGIILNSRMWSKVPMEFFAGLVQVRKDGNFFMYACHFLEQVDKQLRDNTQGYIECRSTTRFDKKLRRPRMVFRWFHEFLPRKYNYWMSDPRFQQNWFVTYVFSTSTWWRLVIPWRVSFSLSFKSWQSFFLDSRVCIAESAESLLFASYDSFQRVDKQKTYSKYLLSNKAGTQPLGGLQLNSFDSRFVA